MDNDDLLLQPDLTPELLMEAYGEKILAKLDDVKVNISIPDFPEFPIIPEFDDSKIVSGLEEIKKAVSGLDFPAPLKTIDVNKPKWYKPLDLAPIVKAVKDTDNSKILDTIQEGLHSFEDPVKVQILDSKKNIIDKFWSTAVATGGGSGSQVQQYVDAATNQTSVYGIPTMWNDGGTYRIPSATYPIPVSATISSAVVKQGAKDASAEDWIVDLTKVGGATFALGQQLAAASLPIVLTTAQITTLTPPAAITGFATETTLALINAKLVSGTDIGDVTINNTAGAGVYVQPGTSTTWDVSDRAARLLGVTYGSQGAQLQQKVTSNDLIVTLDGESVAVTGTFWQATQPVSGTFWQATQPVSGTFWQATQPVSVASGQIVSGAIADVLADDAAFTVATSRVFPMGAMADETSTDSVDEGDVGVPRMTPNRILYSQQSWAGASTQQTTVSATGATDISAAIAGGTYLVVLGVSLSNEDDANPFLVGLRFTGGADFWQGMVVPGFDKWIPIPAGVHIGGSGNELQLYVDGATAPTNIQTTAYWTTK